VASAETVDAVEVEVRIAAKLETVFDFFTDPGKMIQWMGRAAELDARPGGAFRCDINGRRIASGEYVEVDPPHRIVFSWGWEGENSEVGPGSTRVEVLLTADGENTHVRLVHHDLPTADSAQNHTRGWRHYLDRLAVVGAGGDPGPDPWSSPDGAPD
jgi:uncharacterized protein YndB with AHSA1/START domain